MAMPHPPGMMPLTQARVAHLRDGLGVLRLGNLLRYDDLHRNGVGAKDGLLHGGPPFARNTSKRERESQGEVWTMRKNEE